MLLSFLIDLIRENNDLKTLSIGSNNSNLKITILRNPVNQGYGGNVKIGFMYAVKNNFDFIALTHADGQYPPEEIPNQLKLLLNYKYDVVFGSRMMQGFNALKGGMPIYKFIGQEKGQRN